MMVIGRRVERVSEMTGVEPGLDISRGYADSARFIDLTAPGLMARQADLRASTWIRCRIPSANLMMSDARNAHFDDCDGRAANFAGTYGPNALLEYCRWPDSSWEGAYLSGTIFARCDLSRASFVRANLFGVTFRDCIVDGADFIGADVRDIEWTGNSGSARGLLSDLELLKEVDGRIYAYRLQPLEDVIGWHGQRYEVGQEYCCDHLDTDPRRGCAAGLHVATLDWCMATAMEEIGCAADGSPAFDILRVSCAPADIIVPWTSGRFRTKSFRVEATVTPDTVRA